MAFFGIGKKSDQKAQALSQPSAAKTSNEKSAAKGPAKKKDLAAQGSRILIKPRITEKSGNLTARSVYTFDIAVTATKRDVVRAIKAEYHVTPRRVRIVTRKPVRMRLRTRRGFGATAASKKAYVTVKKGDRIEFAS